MKTRSSLFPVLAMLGMLSACGPRNGLPSERRIRPRPPAKSTTLERPAESLQIPVGEEIRVQLGIPDTLAFDSIQVFLGGELKQTLTDRVQTSLSSEGFSLGIKGLRTRVFLSSGQSENHTRQITLLSDQKPVEHGYRVINEYPHDREAYTQGLQYASGWLYEGTGNYGRSSLRRVELETGEVKQIRNLDESLWGEGITVFGDRIYQLTYKSQIGFVYDRESFEVIRKVYYQNREGWGLTHNEEELIMSDGSNVIYFLDPEMFTINRQIEIYHDRGPAKDLNELEYIKGKIWANRFYTDEIVIIDPLSGKVEGRINLKGILAAADREATTDVLNGIAWDRERDRIFITGKYWPKLFEIRLSSPRKSP
jgi:glutamine cyclotransferase